MHRKGDIRRLPVPGPQVPTFTGRAPLPVSRCRRLPPSGAGYPPDKGVLCREHETAQSRRRRRDPACRLPCNARSPQSTIPPRRLKDPWPPLEMAGPGDCPPRLKSKNPIASRRRHGAVLGAQRGCSAAPASLVPAITRSTARDRRGLQPHGGGPPSTRGPPRPPFFPVRQSRTGPSKPRAAIPSRRPLLSRSLQGMHEPEQASIVGWHRRAATAVFDPKKKTSSSNPACSIHLPHAPGTARSAAPRACLPKRRASRQRFFVHDHRAVCRGARQRSFRSNAPVATTAGQTFRRDLNKLLASPTRARQTPSRFTWGLRLDFAPTSIRRIACPSTSCLPISASSRADRTEAPQRIRFVRFELVWLRLTRAPSPQVRRRLTAAITKYRR